MILHWFPLPLQLLILFRYIHNSSCLHLFQARRCDFAQMLVIFPQEAITYDWEGSCLWPECFTGNNETYCKLVHMERVYFIWDHLKIFETISEWKRSFWWFPQHWYGWNVLQFSMCSTELLDRRRCCLRSRISNNVFLWIMVWVEYHKWIVLLETRNQECGYLNRLVIDNINYWPLGQTLT